MDRSHVITSPGCVAGGTGGCGCQDRAHDDTTQASVDGNPGCSPDFFVLDWVLS
jgi:hypothetical protein